MPGNIWVFAEQWRGAISETTYEAIALGREVADVLGVKLEVILLGHDIKNMARTLGKADNVLYVDSPLLAQPVGGPQGDAVVALSRKRQPRAILFPLTNVTLGIGTETSDKLGVPTINFCHDLIVEDGKLEAKCTLYGGKMDATVVVGDGAVLGVWPGARLAENGKDTSAPPIEEVVVAIADEEAVRFKRYIEPEAGDVDITQQDVLVAVGRGLQGQDNLELAEELAAELGGAVCGSRPAIDQGWLPLSRQIGKSGLTVKPKLYLAAGISGAPEHVEGIKGSGMIVAINTDPQAPIFNIAQYGIVGDALDVLPAITEAVKAKKG